jgi:hypothetical protein
MAGALPYPLTNHEKDILHHVSRKPDGVSPCLKVSHPLGSSRKFDKYYCFFVSVRVSYRRCPNGNADVAQPVEHILGKDEVTRSIRVISSTVKPPNLYGFGGFSYNNIIANRS